MGFGNSEQKQANGLYKRERYEVSRVMGYSDHKYEDILMYETDIVSANIIRVAAGTNGYHGGDSGHGSRTVIEIEDEGSTDIRCEMIPPRPFSGCNGGVRIELGGDCELTTIIQGLEFILKALKEQAVDHKS